MTEYSAENDNEFYDPERPLKVHEDMMDELHMAIWTMVQRAAHIPRFRAVPRYETAKPYHPAFVASRLQQLETMVGTLAAFIVRAEICTNEDLVNFIGQTYIADIHELELRGATLGATVFLGQAKAERDKCLTDVVKQDEDWSDDKEAAYEDAQVEHALRHELADLEKER